MYLDPIADMLEWVGHHKKQAQELLGVSGETIRRWLKDSNGVSGRSLSKWLQYMMSTGDTVTPRDVAENTYDKVPWHVHNFKGRDLSVLMPIYRETNGGTLTAAVAIALDLGVERCRFDVEMGDAMVYHSRNKLADRFLATGATWSLWIDSDIIPPIGRAGWFKWITASPNDYPDTLANKHVVHDLLAAKKTIIGGTYFGRQNGGVFMSSGMRDQDQTRKARNGSDEVFPVDWIATGCLLVHRQVYLDIQKKFPELAPSGHRKEWDFFLPGEDGGEDVKFCERSRKSGHQVFAHTGVQCGHVGYRIYGKWNTTGGVVGNSLLT